MNTNNYFAVDLGATSGRTMVGTLTSGQLTLKELTRFDNPLTQLGGHVYWDIYALYREIIGGLRLAASRGIAIESIGIDTWGCDFVCIGSDGLPLRNPLSYRDPHTMGMMERFFEEKMDCQTVYRKTGIQFMNFNSLFQLYSMRETGDASVSSAKQILFIPDALIYLLTGSAVCEYTVASTSQLLNPQTRELDGDLLAAVGLQRNQFGQMVQPGTVVGTLSEEVQRLTGLQAIPVIAVAGHDTASAVAAVPAKDRHFAYLSSGTWSLMGIESRQPIISGRSFELNFTNEGGIEGTTRFLKNICGMWLYECCRREWKQEDGDESAVSHERLLTDAMQADSFRSLINPDDAAFANPPSMVEAIQNYCRKTSQPIPESRAQLCRCIFESLALRYRQVFAWLQDQADFDIRVLHVIGGGSLNRHLNQFTANACGVTVLAGPQEATAFGNVMLQAKAAGSVADIWQMREVVAKSVSLERYEPKDAGAWDKAYTKFLNITK